MYIFIIFHIVFNYFKKYSVILNSAAITTWICMVKCQETDFGDGIHFTHLISTEHVSPSKLVFNVLFIISGENIASSASADLQH